MTDVPEMVERVARAMVAASLREDFGSSEIDGHPDSVAKAIDEVWPHFANQARAAIAAIREPTEKMVEAAEGILLDNPFGPPIGDDARLIWQASIDAALGNPPVAR